MGYDSPAKAKKMAYLTLVRPILEYCTTLWNPQTKNLIEKLEQIQRRATNFVLNNKHRLTDGYIDYKTRLTELNLLPCNYLAVPGTNIPGNCLQLYCTAFVCAKMNKIK